MKILIKKRLISLLLVFAMVLSLSPAALASGNDGSTPETPPAGGDTTDPPAGDGDNTDGDGKDDPDKDEDDEEDKDDHSGDKLFFTFTQGTSRFDPSNGLLINQLGNAASIRVNITARDANNKVIRTHDDDRISWESADPSVAEPHRLKDANGKDTGRTFLVEAKKPGITTITGTVSDANGNPLTVKEEYRVIKFQVTVSGIQPNSSTLTIKENEGKLLPKCEPGSDDPFGIVYYGAAANGPVSILSNQLNIVDATGSDRNGLRIDGISAGSTSVTITAGSYKASITVEVEPSITEPIEAEASPSDPLRFSTIEEAIAAQCREAMSAAEGDSTLISITSLTVPTAEGTIYLGYKSPEDTGAGAGSSLAYYASNQPRGPYIKDLTFVPNPSFTGEKAVIRFTGRAANNRTFKGRIEVTLEDAKTDVSLIAPNGGPLDLSSENFADVCQAQTGSALRYVIFTLPPASQGALYLDYKDEWNYAAKVSPNEQYDRKQLDTITFVPAEGYVGAVRIGYAGYSVSGVKYNGELVIQVKQGLDDAVTYNDNGGGEVRFDSGDFEDFCENATGKALSKISFTLPPASQGVLYLNWNGSRGTEAAEGREYSSSQLDRMTFVAAGGFNGVVRIPFSGVSRSGLNFTGTVEIHIQSTGAGTGDITYICAPSQSVKLSLSDFSNLCQAMTGQRLHYISFQSLPDFNQGSLYHNRTSAGSMGVRVTTATRYFNSATPYIANLSFWAASGFSGVDIPFTGSSVNGQTFTGVLTISTGAGAGSGLAGAVTYTASGQTPVPFSGGDFDTACRQATNAALSYLQFGLPSSGQGILYYDYRAGTAPTALNPGTTLYRSGEVSVDKVSFVAAKGFSGIAMIPFTGWAIDGRQFQGSVQITVRSDAALGGLVRYESRGEPVHINAYDIQTASGGAPASLRLTGLPDAGSGKLYYQYAGPTRYSWQGNTSTVYSLYGDPSVSNLTFVPKAGFYGTVDVPYTANNTDGTQYTGTIRITVTEPSVSANFDDLSGYSAQMKSAVDYLYNLDVVKGTGQRRYEPGASIRRGDFCVMLSRAFQFNVGSTVQGFSDVPADAYYTQSVNELYALGIVTGVGGGRFDPNASLSRQDAALMVQRALNQAGISAPDGNAAALAAYSDRGRVADYAKGAVSGLIQQGLLPTSGGRISPRNNLNRGDMALLLHRSMTR